MLSRNGPRPLRRQSGVMLLEALIGILIFSLGVLAMVGLQAASISAAADAEYRSEAASAADQIVAQIWLSADRSSSGALQTSLNAFQYNVTGGTCAFSGGLANGANATVTDWVTRLTSGASTALPGATGSMQQILVDTASNNLVTVTVCWQGPHDAQPHRHVITANIS